ncbi:MAG: tRNA guanosine(15) transglycosylase TgtA [Candidatus Helarchaeota archaeon]|nr:tRNA guanosine(15) transglycosylase TgtA [Candidatus Helarchaeota archaeon]
MFEIIARDAAGRLGRIKTSHGYVLTPTLMPVYNPNIPIIPAKELEHEFKIQMLITNAYIIYRTPKLREQANQGVHTLINFHKAIMTDSGAYQAWMYKKELGVTNREIIQFEEILEPDIATILDVFTETNDYDIAREGVLKTIEAAKECIEIRQNEKIFWAAPIQGGQFLDLLENCAKQLSGLDFDVHPLGTLAPSLQKYNFKQVAETILVTKKNLIPSRPFHGFSIGHPIFFALAVALGIDLFDSSAYALYARDNRYLTVSGTLRFENLEEFPCVCPICTKFTPHDLKELDNRQREYLLAKHNLYITIDEIKRIRVAIRENRLWELVQERIRAHPTLIDALNYILSKYSEFFLTYDPITKKSGFFYGGPESLLRPEVKRHEKKLDEIYTPPPNAQFLLLIPDLDIRFENSTQFQKWSEIINQNPHRNLIHICLYSPIFGIIPEELKDIYPLTQHEYPKIFDIHMTLHSKTVFQKFLKKHQSVYKKIYIFRPKTYYDTNGNKKDLISHSIDEIIKDFEKKFIIFNSIEQLKKELDRLLE